MYILKLPVVDAVEYEESGVWSQATESPDPINL